MNAMRGLSGAYHKADVETALARINSLEQELEVIKKPGDN